MSTRGIVPVRDSKVPAGPTFAVSARAFAAFVDSVKAGPLVTGARRVYDPAMTTATNATRPCACGSYSYLVLLHATPHGDRTWEPRTTRCTSTTQSTYAPGHDAKLRTFLVEAGVAGVQVRKSEEKVVVERDAVRIADDLGWGDDVRKAVEKGKGEA